MPLGRQESSHDGYVAADAWHDCAQCVMRHGQRHEFPPLDPEHVEAWTIFQAVAGQQRIGMDVIGLDYAVLPTVFDLYGVPPGDDRRVLFERIAILSEAQQADRARRAALKSAEEANRRDAKALDGR